MSTLDQRDELSGDGGRGGHHARGRRSALLVGVIGAAVVLTALIVVASHLESRSHLQRNAGAEVVTPNLAIRNAEVVPDAPDAQGRETVKYEIAWTGTSFPGTHRCTWEALGADGAVVGSYSTEVMSLQPLATGEHEIAVSAPALSARGSCEAKRLDSDKNEYTFSNVSIKPDGLTESTATYDVTFDWQWTGTERSGAVSCFVRFVDAQGNVLADHPVNITLSSTSGSMTFTVSEPALKEAGVPSAASLVDCAPFGS